MAKGTKEQIKQQRRRRYERAKEYLLNYKQDKSCDSCGWKEHTKILCFHHKRKKAFEINNANNKSIIKVMKEIKKCVLLCPNCHMLHHNTNGN